MIKKFNFFKLFSQIPGGFIIYFLNNKKMNNFLAVVGVMINERQEKKRV